jgi:DNA-binding NtrC family response regulator
MDTINSENSDDSATVIQERIGARAGIITNDPAMLSIFKYIESVAKTSQPVLITGETGVGKELIAKNIHLESQLNGSLVTVNVAGLDDNVFSDTLFGHAKGAFTGADGIRQGLIEKAENGIIFFDEIGDLSHASQVKLLRLIQEGEYLPLGQDDLKYSNARIVTATNADLWDLNRNGRFREDLNYRLRTHHINVPPLRDRMDDLPLLVDHFFEKAANELKKRKPTPPKELIPLLSTYSFPGNIRELESIVFDAVSRHTHKVLSLDAFHDYIDDKRKINRAVAEEETDGVVIFPDELPTIKEAAEQLVDEALRRAGGSLTIAAKMVGVSRQALGKRLKNRKK